MGCLRCAALWERSALGAVKLHALEGALLSLTLIILRALEWELFTNTNLTLQFSLIISTHQFCVYYYFIILHFNSFLEFLFYLQGWIFQTNIQIKFNFIFWFLWSVKNRLRPRSVGEKQWIFGWIQCFSVPTVCLLRCVRFAPHPVCLL